jgi:hypothetical protein
VSKRGRALAPTTRQRYAFVEWVSSTHPRDAAVMYLDRTLAQWRLSLEWIRLREWHTRAHGRRPAFCRDSGVDLRPARLPK